MKSILAALVAIGTGIGLAPSAAADPQDQAFLSYLAAHKVSVDTKTALEAGHIACTQMTAGVPASTIDDLLTKRFPTTINGAEYWIVDAARKTYCSNLS